MAVEIFVVDNNSVDSSCSMLKAKFPDIQLIENKQNLGFARANNQAIRKAAGRYLLLLNPDTVIEEDTLNKCVRFMNDHPDAGALGVKMIDGKGMFLPESKRSLPTPMVAFYKIFGLSGLFPRSRVFGRYHLGYLDRDKIHEVDVLPGAFMMLRREALDRTGLLDEDFFMYGEDVDISYRMNKAGYRNYYFPETTIIHYKGESTRKGSLNYVVTFYNAMIIFARKHFSPKMAKSYTFLINLAIYFRAFLAIARRTVKSIILPLLDAFLFYTGFLLIKPVWEGYRFPGGGTYPHEYMIIIVPAYILLWMVSLFFAGGYDKPIRLVNVIKGILSGTLIILVVYALLPESLRYSRALLLIGATWAMITSITLRFLLNLLRIKGFELALFQKKRIIIIGREQEAERVESLLKQADKKVEIMGHVCPDPSVSENSMGSYEQLQEIIRVNRINELIFCAQDMPSREIIRQMISLGTVNLDYKIAPPESLTVIGSNSINTPGDLYLIDFNSLNNPVSKRNKRLFDFLASLAVLLLFPILLFIVRHPGRLPVNIFRVLTGLYSWVGYAPVDPSDLRELPKVRKGILTPLDAISESLTAPGIAETVNITYARDYRILKDANILLRGFRHMGREPGKK